MGIENIELLKPWGFNSSDNTGPLPQYVEPNPPGQSDTITATIGPTI